MAKATNFITQTAARRLRAAMKRAEKRIEQLQSERDRMFTRWGGDIPGGTHITSLTVSDTNFAAVAIRTARTLGHAVVAIERSGEIAFMAVTTRNKS